MRCSLAILAAAVLCLTTTAFVDEGRVVTLGDIQYYIGGISVGQIGENSAWKAFMTSGRIFQQGLLPLTAMETSASEFLPAELMSITTSYDDVFQPTFLETIYLRSTLEHNTTINGTAFASRLDGFNHTYLISECVARSSECTQGLLNLNLPKGPYFVSVPTGNLSKAHRLYPDDNLAFVQGVFSDESVGYKSLPAVTENIMAKSIAVPSRLYYTESEERPLAGLRFGIKDIFPCQGRRYEWWKPRLFLPLRATKCHRTCSSATYRSWSCSCRQDGNCAICHWGPCYRGLSQCSRSFQP